MNILIRIYLRRILELVSCGICKWLCNSAFRFCSSTNGYATLHFDFVHRQMAMQLYISVLFINKWLCNFTFRFCSSTKWLCNFTFRFCSSTKWLCNFAFRFCSSTKWLCNFTFRFCSSTKWLCNFAMRSADFACYRYQLQLLFFSQSRISTIFALGRSS